MKSSWKKQRQAAHRSSSERRKWRNRFIKLYGYKDRNYLLISISKSFRKVAEHIAVVNAAFRKMGTSIA